MSGALGAAARAAFRRETTGAGVPVGAGIPAPIVSRLNAACAAALHAPDMQDRLRALAITPAVRPPEAWPAYLAAESAKWREVIRARNIRVT